MHGGLAVKRAVPFLQAAQATRYQPGQLRKPPCDLALAPCKSLVHGNPENMERQQRAHVGLNGYDLVWKTADMQADIRLLREQAGRLVRHPDNLLPGRKNGE